jgi:hypothetical protein
MNARKRKKQYSYHLIFAAGKNQLGVCTAFEITKKSDGV